MAANFNSYKVAIRSGKTPQQAAGNHTFTGHMAKKYGYKKVRIVTDDWMIVEVEFTK